MNLNPFSKSFNENPADAAMPYLDQIPETITPYYNPYINAGRTSLKELMSQYGSLIKDPVALMNQIAATYSQSPGYGFQMNQAMNGANAAAAAGGTLGSSGHQMHAASMAGDVANQDFYNFLTRALNLYDTGLKGYGDINQLGYGASSELANSLSNNLTNQAGMQFAGTQHQNQANADNFNSLLGLGSAVGTGLINKFLKGR